MNTTNVNGYNELCVYSPNLFQDVVLVYSRWRLKCFTCSPQCLSSIKVCILPVCYVWSLLLNLRDTHYITQVKSKVLIYKFELMSISMTNGVVARFTEALKNCFEMLIMDLSKVQLH